MRHRRPGPFPVIGVLATAFALVAVATSQAVRGQTPAPAENPAKPPAATAGQEAAVTPGVGSLTAKYRLQERFTSKDVTKNEKSTAGMIGQYQVGFREKISTGKEPLVTQAIFTERPAMVSPVDERLVTELIRKYESVKITPNPFKDRKDAPLHQNLTIWYRRESADTPPQAVVLTPDRELWEEEYRFAVNYDFVTNFAYLLPDRPIRIADTWTVSRAGAVALINDDSIKGGNLTGKLAEIRAHPRVPEMQLAILNVTGQLAVSRGQTIQDISLNARIQFAFTPSKSQDEKEIDAFGAIEKLSLAQVSTYRAQGLTKTTEYKRELIFERKQPGKEPTIPLPEPMPPKATPKNSWLQYEDPNGQFQLRHPQEFQPDLSRNAKNSTVLARFHADIPDDIVTFEFVEKPQARPEILFKQLVDDWKSKGIEVLGGFPTKLPAADWPKMTVHHMEAVLKPPETGGRPAARPYFDAYMIQFPRNVALYITATTFQDDPTAFRKQVLDMLKTIILKQPKS